jgi:hypothetical protein
MCTVLLPPGDNPIAVKYIISYILNFHVKTVFVIVDSKTIVEFTQIPIQYLAVGHYMCPFIEHICHAIWTPLDSTVIRETMCQKQAYIKKINKNDIHH